MATIVQTYRVGVQNRYSGFLEGEEGLALSNSLVKKPVPVANNKQQKSATSGASKPSVSASKVNGKSEVSLGHANKRHDAQAKNSSTAATQQGGQSKVANEPGRRQQRDGGRAQAHSQQTGAGSTQVKTVRHQNKNRNHNQSSGTAESMARSPRNQVSVNSVNQPDGSQSKENRAVRGANNNPRFNRPRAQNGDKGSDHHQQQQDGHQLNSHLPLNEGDKVRHQQRRMNNLRFKDPEKRERRAQGDVHQDGGAEAQVKSEPQSEGERAGSQEQRISGPRVRRDGEKNLGDSKNSRPRPPRRVNQNNGEAAPNSAERRDVRRERPAARQRNGFGAGSHQSESGGGRQDRQRPIPNFSDKSDFPSLAS